MYLSWTIFLDSRIETIVSSEIRVLQTLGFQVQFSTPLETIEILLAVWQHDFALEHDGVQILLDQSERILDLAVLEWSLVYDRFRQKILEVSGITAEDWDWWRRSPFCQAEWRKMSLSLKRVEVDRMLLAAAVILAAAQTLVDAFPEALIDRMASYSQIAAEHLVSLADVIVGIL